MRANHQDIDDTNRAIVRFIQEFQRNYGHSPSYDEIGEHVGMKKQSIQARIEGLVRANILSRKRGQPRTLKVTRPL